MQLLQQVATAAGKGQLITKLLFGVLNFPKNQRKNLKDLCLESRMMIVGRQNSIASLPLL